MKYSPEPAEANTILCLEIFQPKRQKNSPAAHVSESEQARLPELIVSHNLELRLRDGENE